MICSYLGSLVFVIEKNTVCEVSFEHLSTFYCHCCKLLAALVVLSGQLGTTEYSSEMCTVIVRKNLLWLSCRTSGCIQEAARWSRDFTADSALGCRENPAQAAEGDCQVSDDRHLHVLCDDDGMSGEART